MKRWIHAAEKYYGVYDKTFNGFDESEFDYYQICQIRRGIEKGLDISYYADPKFDWQQMYQIREGLESGLDVSKYAKPELDWKQMLKIRESMERSNTKATSAKIVKTVINYIKERTSEGRKDGTAFIDGDDFAFCVDEAAYYGEISECIEGVIEAVQEDPDVMDDIGSALYDYMKVTYNIGKIVDLFREHGVELPDWYFE